MPLLQLTRHIALWISRGFAGESFSISQISSSLQALNCAVYFCMYMIIARSFDHFAQPQVYLRLFFLLNDVRRLSHDHRRITRHPNQSWIALLQNYSIASHHTAHTDLFPIFTPQCDPGYCPMHFPQVRCVQCSMHKCLLCAKSLSPIHQIAFIQVRNDSEELSISRFDRRPWCGSFIASVDTFYIFINIYLLTGEVIYRDNWRHHR